jgi:hypothetical protein
MARSDGVPLPVENDHCRVSLRAPTDPLSSFAAFMAIYVLVEVCFVMLRVHRAASRNLMS